jgi:phospholipid transport system substrate-binding protein
MRMLVLVRTVSLLLIWCLWLAPAWATPGPPTDAVKGAVQGVLDILNNPAYAHRKTERRQLVKQTVDARFDYREMAKRSLGMNWRNLSEAQRSEFVSLFAQLLEASYYDKIEKFTKHLKIEYTGEVVDDGYAEVKSVIVRPNDRIPFNFRLIKDSGTWKAYDVVIEGVSLVANYRSQFARVINESSYNELVRRLRTQVNSLQNRTG